MINVNASPAPNQIFYEHVGCLHEDIIRKIFVACVSMGHVASLDSLALVNLYYNSTIKWCFDTIHLKQSLPPGLVIVDAQLLATQGITVEDEPLIDNRAVLKDWKDLTFSTDEHRGAVYLTIGKGFSLNSTVAFANKGENKITIRFFSNQILPSKGAVCVEKTYRVMITQGLLKNTQGKNPIVQTDIVESFKCREPEAIEKLFFYVAMWKLFQVCPFGDHLSAAGRTTTVFQDLAAGTQYNLFPVFPIGVGDFTHLLMVNQLSFVYSTAFGTGRTSALQDAVTHL